MKKLKIFGGARKAFHRAVWLAGVAAAVIAPSVRAQNVAFGSFPNNSTHSNSAVMAAIANVPTNVGVVYDPIGQTNFIQVYNFNDLIYAGPVNVSQTLQRIRLGYHMPTESDDGGFFNFDDSSELPNIPRKGNNYYMEFMVWPFLNFTNATYNTSEDAYGEAAFPGPMRLLIGLGGEVWFTGDHYGEDGLQINAENVIPPPPTGLFKLTSVVVQGTNTLLTWNTIGGQTNIVQASSGIPGAASNNFTNLSGNIIAGGGDLTIASYLEVGGARRYLSRIYRVTLFQ